MKRSTRNSLLIHVAADEANGLLHARTVAHSFGGWMLREAGGHDADDGFGCPLPNVDLMLRIKEAFDPDWLLNPSKVFPLLEPEADALPQAA